MIDKNENDKIWVLKGNILKFLILIQLRFILKNNFSKKCLKNSKKKEKKII